MTFRQISKQGKEKQNWRNSPTEVELTSDGGGPGGLWVLVEMAGAVAFCTPVTITHIKDEDKVVKRPYGK